MNLSFSKFSIGNSFTRNWIWESLSLVSWVTKEWAPQQVSMEAPTDPICHWTPRTDATHKFKTDSLHRILEKMCKCTAGPASHLSIRSFDRWHQNSRRSIILNSHSQTRRWSKICLGKHLDYYSTIVQLLRHDLTHHRIVCFVSQYVFYQSFLGCFRIYVNGPFWHVVIQDLKTYSTNTFWLSLVVVFSKSVNLEIRDDLY